MQRLYRQRIEQLLGNADIRIAGSRPWDVRVHDERVYDRIATDGMLGVGETYMEGAWDCDQLDEMIARAFNAGFHRQARNFRHSLFVLHARLRNLQSRGRAAAVAKTHYDIGDDIYRAMLDHRMIYSCGYWRRATTLDQAQEHKLDLVARKLQLAPGMRVLDIGCGWGGALHYLAERYGIEGTGVTISEHQFAAARELLRDRPIEIRLQDYRDLDGRYDRIYSIGMFEHVGYKNYRDYMQIVRNCLARDGLFLLHTIGAQLSAARTDPWLTRYIFPNGMLPSAAQITQAAEGLLKLEDWHNFPQDYERTLLCWYDNFENAWETLRARYDERFFRMWRYYLLASAGGFRAGGNQLWQIVWSRDGVPGGYRADGIR